MTETPTTFPVFGQGLTDKELAKNREREKMIHECVALLEAYSQALIERDNYLSRGEGRTYVISMGVLPDKLKPQLKPEEKASIEKKMRELQDSLNKIIKQLIEEPYGFRFNYGGFLDKEACQGFAREFLNEPQYKRLKDSLNFLTGPSPIEAYSLPQIGKQTEPPAPPEPVYPSVDP